MNTTRSLHLVDLENLCGSGLPTTSVIEDVWHTYRFGVQTSVDDLFVVGCGHSCAKNAWFVLPQQGIVRRVRSGKDGGELSMLDNLDLRHAAGRYDRLVIASGDGMFSETALAARGYGMHVHQVSGVGKCSRALAATAHTHSWLRLPMLTQARRPAVAQADQVLAA